MIRTYLKFENWPATEAAKFRFQSGIDLIVIANGPGNTRVLRAMSNHTLRRGR